MGLSLVTGAIHPGRLCSELAEALLELVTVEVVAVLLSRFTVTSA